MNSTVKNYQETGDFLSYKEPWRYGNVLEINCNELINVGKEFEELSDYFNPFIETFDKFKKILTPWVAEELNSKKVNLKTFYLI